MCALDGGFLLLLSKRLFLIQRGLYSVCCLLSRVVIRSAAVAVSNVGVRVRVGQVLTNTLHVQLLRAALRSLLNAAKSRLLAVTQWW